MLFDAFQRYEEAIRQFTVAHDAGYPWASIGLGAAYAAGEGVEKDAARALRFYREAEAGGVKAAWAGIGWFYETGVGVAADAGEAAKR